MLGGIDPDRTVCAHLITNYPSIDLLIIWYDIVDDNQRNLKLTTA